MKITELENNMPHLFLDMDGVQADFFGKWAEEHNVEHYKYIPHFEKAIEELANSNPDRVREFFSTLEPLPGGKVIVNWLKTNRIPFTVLSAPLRGPYYKDSIQGKKEWLDKYLPGYSSTAIFTRDKYKFAKINGVTNVLVDDFGKYINEWVEAGGIGVKHENENTNRTIQRLEEIYSKFLTV